MRLGTLGVIALAVLFAPTISPWQAAADEKEDYGKLLKVLPKSKHSLAEGIKQAAAKAPEVAISAKFELEDGKLSLSVYTAQKGFGGDSEHNILKELSGSPETTQWKPEVEVFKDVPHVSRSAEQFTLMSLSKFSLLDILAKAEKDQAGTVFSIIPVLHDRKAHAEVLVANDGKVVELHYDLMTGQRVKSAKQ